MGNLIACIKKPKVEITGKIKDNKCFDHDDLTCPSSCCIISFTKRYNHSPSDKSKINESRKSRLDKILLQRNRTI